jgi:MraZ protein
VGNSGELFMFIGQYEYRIDEKGRVPIPPKFRTEELKKEGLVLCPGMEKCITIYPLSEWKRLADTLNTSPVKSSKFRKLNRAFFSNAFNVEIDGQGRIIVPSQFRQFAGINEDVVVAGANTYIELWSKELWGSEKESNQEAAWQIFETMERN